MSKVIQQKLKQAIEIIGSQMAVAEVCGVSQAAVSKALHEKRCPAEWAVAIERATDGVVSKSDLRPDLWPRDEVAA